LSQEIFLSEIQPRITATTNLYILIFYTDISAEVKVSPHTFGIYIPAMRLIRVRDWFEGRDRHSAGLFIPHEKYVSSSLET
jgi:hypothetical protein